MLEAFFPSQYSQRVEALFQAKQAAAERLLGRAPLRSLRPEPQHDRTRVDLMWREGVLGFRGPAEADGSYKLEALKAPETPSLVILEMMAVLRMDPPPLRLAQLRFRSGLNGIAGLWIDTANEAIRDLLAEQGWLERALKRGWTVEVGQKRKEVILRDDGLGLTFARPRVWLPSVDRDGRDIPVLSLIALFSQPGPEANRALLAAGFDLLDEAGIERPSWREWGAGYGNLTAGFASRLGKVAVSTEFEAPAAELLEENCRRFCPHVKAGREAAEKSSFDVGSHELWLLDPPRPGFGPLLRRLPELSEPPRWILVYHCHESGRSTDASILGQAGYSLVNWSAVDAFPGTPHLESVSLWTRPNLLPDGKPLP